MLEIHDVDVFKRGKLNISNRKSKKHQILLYDTQRRTDDFINKIKYRRNGNYNDIPHFIITKLGIVYNIFSTEYSSNTFDDPKKDKKVIKIALENLGWLNKNTINGVLYNWINDPYRSEPYIKNWRGHHFWDKYSDSQMDSLSELCKMLCSKNNIPHQSVPSQGFLENVSNFKGIVCKSNFSSIYTDINPSFNFRNLFKNAE